jgi:ribosomal protein S18 acetylase RimI-like enzyme
MVRLEDWRDSPPQDVAVLLQRETQAWAADLDWDVREAWRPVEPARAAGRLPGFIARAAGGGICGWTCFLLHKGALQVAMFVADAPDVTAALVDAILGSVEAAGAAIGTVCVRDGAPGLAEALGSRGFDVCAYGYRSAPVAHWVAHPLPVSSWRPADLDRMADLCRRAYRDAPGVRAFAPLDTPEEWREYVGGLAIGLGCGRLMADASFTVRREGSDRFDAAILTTNLGPGTAHIAQLVVDPDARGRGVAAALVAAVMDAVLPLGFRQVTLLVAEDNDPAVRIYDRFEFQERASFVVAANRQPRRLRSVALATGGARTRL